MTRKVPRRLGRLVPACIMAAAVLGAAHGGAAAADPPRFPFDFVPAAKQAAEVRDEANKGPRTRVYHGDVAAEGAWPWQVGLLHRNDEETVFERQFCGGSLVTRGWVLTAAHCVYDDDDEGKQKLVAAGEIEVLAGTNLLMAGSGEIVAVAAVHPHPDYDPESMDHDLALLELAHPVESAGVRPVQLPTREVEPAIAAEGIPAFVVGWGEMEDGGFPVDLRQTSTIVMDRSACNQAMVQRGAKDQRADFDAIADNLGTPADIADRAWAILLSGASARITDNMVCSGYTDRPRGSCRGDSGGPLMVQLPDQSFVQIGVVSWGDMRDNDVGCQTEGNFAAYTRVANYADWIRQTIMAPAAPAEPPPDH